MTAMSRLLPLLLLPLLPGCLVSKTVNHEALDPAAVAAIRPGESTAEDVLELLGAPNEVVQLGRRSAYRYDHSVQKQAGLFLVLVGLRGVDRQEDRIWIFFDEEEIVMHAGATFEAADAAYALPWS